MLIADKSKESSTILCQLAGPLDTRHIVSMSFWLDHQKGGVCLLVVSCMDSSAKAIREIAEIKLEFAVAQLVDVKEIQ